MSSLIFVSSPLVVEVLALREAVSFAANLKFQHVLFESNSLDLIEACRGNLIRKEIEIIIKDINFLRQEFTSMGILWTNRHGNEVADLVAHLAASMSLPRNWVSYSSAALLIDGMGLQCCSWCFGIPFSF